MPNPPDKPKKPRDYARPTRAKAARPDAPAPEPTLDRLLNPGIERGTAGMGSGTGLQQPPDNSFELATARYAMQLGLQLERLTQPDVVDADFGRRMGLHFMGGGRDGLPG